MKLIKLLTHLNTLNTVTTSSKLLLVLQKQRNILKVNYTSLYFTDMPVFNGPLKI